MKKLFTSRTFWTILVMFLIGGIEAVAQFIPDSLETLVLGFLGMLAVYFKLNPSQEY